MNRSMFLLVFSLILLGPGLAHAQSSTGSPTQPAIAEGENGMDTSFARISTDPRPLYDGPATPIQALILVKNASRVADAHILMLGFNGLSDAVRITMEDPETADGIVLPIHQDNRTDGPQQPKVWIKPADLPTSEPMVLRGTVTADANGQFHVGAILIAFDEDYQKFVTPANEFAEVYAFGLLGVTDADANGAPFRGQGNVPAAGALGTIAAVVAVALLARRRA